MRYEDQMQRGNRRRDKMHSVGAMGGTPDMFKPVTAPNPGGYLSLPGGGPMNAPGGYSMPMSGQPNGRTSPGFPPPQDRVNPKNGGWNPGGMGMNPDMMKYLQYGQGDPGAYNDQMRQIFQNPMLLRMLFGIG